MFTPAKYRLVILTFLRDLRALWRLLQVAALIGGGIVTVRGLFPWLSPQLRQRIKQAWAARLVCTLGVRIESRGGELPPGSLIVSNHISWLDVFIINALAPTTFVCKDDVKHWPAIGWLVEHTETLFIERGNRAAAARSAQAMAERLRQGERVAVFPEGTSTPGNHMLPFRAALFEAALSAEAAVQPLALRYTDAAGKTSLAAAYYGEISFIESLLSIARSPRVHARLEVLPTLAPEQQERRSLAKQSEAAIADALGFLRPTQEAALESRTPGTSPGELINPESFPIP